MRPATEPPPGVGAEEEIESKKNSKGFIFDGFPRTVNQAEALDYMLNEKGLRINFLISLEVDDDELINRIKKRALVSGRIDDQSEDKINNRIKVYNEETLPVLNHYKKLKKYNPVNGVGSIDEIFDDKFSAILSSKSLIISESLSILEK